MSGSQGTHCGRFESYKVLEYSVLCVHCRNMKIHLQDQDVPMGEVMQLHITATNEGIGFGGSGIYFYSLLH